MTTTKPEEERKRAPRMTYSQDIKDQLAQIAYSLQAIQDNQAALIVSHERLTERVNHLELTVAKMEGSIMTRMEITQELAARVPMSTYLAEKQSIERRLNDLETERREAPQHQWSRRAVATAVTGTIFAILTGVAGFVLALLTYLK